MILYMHFKAKIHFDLIVFFLTFSTQNMISICLEVTLFPLKLYLEKQHFQVGKGD